MSFTKPTYFGVFHRLAVRWPRFLKPVNPGHAVSAFFLDTVPLDKSISLLGSGNCRRHRSMGLFLGRAEVRVDLGKTGITPLASQNAVSVEIGRSLETALPQLPDPVGWELEPFTHQNSSDTYVS